MQKRQCRTEEKKGNATSSRMGFCDSILEELSALSTYELKLQDIFPVSIKGGRDNETVSGEKADIGELIQSHKAVENEEAGEEFVDLAEFKEATELDPFQYEVKLSDKHRSKHYKEEQKIRERLRKMFPNAPPASRTAHIYKSRGYNIKSAGTQVPHDQEERSEGQ